MSLVKEYLALRKLGHTPASAWAIACGIEEDSPLIGTQELLNDSFWDRLS